MSNGGWLKTGSTAKRSLRRVTTRPKAFQGVPVRVIVRQLAFGGIWRWWPSSSCRQTTSGGHVAAIHRVRRAGPNAMTFQVAILTQER